MKHRFCILLVLAAVGCQNPCVRPDSPYADSGVSQELAVLRRATVSDLHYALQFDLPECRETPVTGTVTLDFSFAGGKDPLILDFKAPDKALRGVKLNGRQVSPVFKNEHIIFNAGDLTRGYNEIEVAFTAPDQSLNRREAFLYTLLVPDRARTLFPCMDQPDLKARYSLTLLVPDGWMAVTNAAKTAQSASIDREGHPKTRIRFSQSEPLSTYLFSFVAGKFQADSLQVSLAQGSRTIHLYHRETDPHKQAQTKAVLEEIAHCLQWMESWTEIPYPFAKYDCIVLPGFQYGGMEHTGATLYNDSRIFLNAQAGETAHRNRFSLIAHETAHMWFGDYVTMRWFNEVWTKEVFANWFAAQMTDGRFPSQGGSLENIGYQRAAYPEDRTPGARPACQPLPNLKYAGLVYSNVIYDKTPILMEMLMQMMGPEAFREGLRLYLQRYAYANASWDDLVAIMDDLTPHNPAAWSAAWLYRSGMPRMKCTLLDNGNRLRLVNDDPERFQTLQIRCFPATPNTHPFSVSVTTSFADTVLALPHKTIAVLPGSDGRAYGSFTLEADGLYYLADNLTALGGAVADGVAMEHLFEALYNKTLDPEIYTLAILRFLAVTQDPVLFSYALADLQAAATLFDMASQVPRTESVLRQLAFHLPRPENCRAAFSLFARMASTPEHIALLSSIFADPGKLTAFELSEDDQISLAYELAVKLPDRAESILDEMRRRIGNPDRLARFDFIRPALSADADRRDAFFESLKNPANRRIEPWVLAGLRYLHHPLRAAHAVKYVLPSLELLEEIQATGDIFFPKNWCSVTLSSHKGYEVRDIVHAFLASKPQYPELLKSKILLCLNP